MKAIIIGGYPELLGKIIDAIPADMLQAESRKHVRLFESDPPILLKGLQCFFQEPHLSFFPPEKDLDAEDDLAILENQLLVVGA
jgi:hypothetical protein